MTGVFARYRVTVAQQGAPVGTIVLADPDHPSIKPLLVKRYLVPVDMPPVSPQEPAEAPPALELDKPVTEPVAVPAAPESGEAE